MWSFYTSSVIVVACMYFLVYVLFITCMSGRVVYEIDKLEPNDESIRILQQFKINE